MSQERLDFGDVVYSEMGNVVWRALAAKRTKRAYRGLVSKPRE